MLFMFLVLKTQWWALTLYPEDCCARVLYPNHQVPNRLQRWFSEAPFNCTCKCCLLSGESVGGPSLPGKCAHGQIPKSTFPRKGEKTDRGTAVYYIWSSVLCGRVSSINLVLFPNSVHFRGCLEPVSSWRVWVESAVEMWVRGRGEC